MLHRLKPWIALASLALLAGAGCGEESTPPASDYLPNVSPMNLVLNLQTAFSKRDAAAYADLLAPEFMHTSQLQDVVDLPTGFYTHDAESTRTAHLLECADLSGVCVLMEPRPPEAADDAGLPADAIRIRTEPRLVLSLQGGGQRCLLMNAQDLYFRPARPEQGEPAGRWYLLEWREIPSGRLGPAAGDAPKALCPCESRNFVNATWLGAWRDSLDCP